MTENGKEVKFKGTMRALLSITEICPDEDVNRIQELFTGGMNRKMILAAIKTIVALSNGSLTEDDVMDMDTEELQSTLDEAMRVFRHDQKPTVEVIVKKDEATAEA